MGSSGAGNNSGYETVPQNCRSPALYAEGEEIGDVKSFLSNLSDKGDFTTIDYNGPVTYSGRDDLTGSEVLERLDLSEDHGYVVAVYRDNGYSESGLEDPEVYVSVAECLPRPFLSRFTGFNPGVEGKRVIGSVDELDTRQLWKEARKAGLEDSRMITKVDKAFRTVFWHKLE